MTDYGWNVVKENTVPKHFAISGLLFLTGIFFLNFTSRIIFSPLLPIIELEMGLNHAESGSLFLVVSCGYFISVFSSGFISAKINHKRTIVLSCIVLGMALLLLGYCTTFLSLTIGLFILGLGAGLYFPSGLATISNNISPAYLARGMSIHELAPNIGFVAAPILCDLFITYINWHLGLIYLGIFVIGSGMLYGLSPNGCRKKGTAPNLSASKVFFCMPIFWGLVVLFSFAICSSIGIYAMAPLFLIMDHGMEFDKANRLLALSRIAAIFIPLVAGWLSDRFGKQLIISLVIFFTGGLTTALAIVDNLLWVKILIVIQPLVAVCFFPAAFAVLSMLKSAEYGNLGVSLCLPIAFLIGAGLMPMLIGLVGDIYSIGFGFFLVGSLMAILGFSLLFMTFAMRKIII